uniref:putative pre-16S rRNA nuclease isoform X2 n=1 Tax=Erigeron canadensis TaxID=72917 RepID=UPI001CB9A17F|nr:putative pre-16S rRNA nuclease isoform X2 [Erigeron canadensis]
MGSLPLGLEMQMKYMKPLSLYQDFLKPRAAQQVRLLGLDVGNKLVGLAISDSDNKIAEPLRVLARDKTDLGPMAVDLQHLISKYSVSAFVIGHPFYSRGNTRRVTQLQQFVNDLSKTGKLEDVPYTFYDDTYSTQIAESLVKPFIIDPTKAKQVISPFAAVSVLQEYLDYITYDVKTEQDK